MTKKRKKVQIRTILHFMITHIRKGDRWFEITPEKEFDFEYGNNTDWGALADELKEDPGIFTVTALYNERVQSILYQVMPDDTIILRNNNDFLYQASGPLQCNKLRLLTVMHGLDHMVEIEITNLESKPKHQNLKIHPNMVHSKAITEDMINKKINAPEGYFKYNEKHRLSDDDYKMDNEHIIDSQDD